MGSSGRRGDGGSGGGHPPGPGGARHLPGQYAVLVATAASCEHLARTLARSAHRDPDFRRGMAHWSAEALRAAREEREAEAAILALVRLGPHRMPR